MSRQWQAGEVAVLRYITTRDALIGMTWPCRVVADRDDRVALFMPRGATFQEWHPSPSAPDRELKRTVSHSDVLRLMFAGRGYSIWLFWRGEGVERRFRGYYVNFEEPFRRTAIGFDTNDHALDLLVAPDLRWTWKDRDEFDERVQQGIYSPAFAEWVYAQAEQVIGLVERRESPFSDGWEQWTPDPAWETPALVPNWRDESPVLWPLRRWAYPSSH